MTCGEEAAYYVVCLLNYNFHLVDVVLTKRGADCVKS